MWCVAPSTGRASRCVAAGPMLCTVCGVTETPCWRRHHRTRALLCNRCGVKVNVLGASKHAHSAYSMRARSRARSAEKGSASGAGRAHEAAPGEQVLRIQHAAHVGHLQSGSPPQQGSLRKRPGCLTPVGRPPRKVRPFCTGCAPLSPALSKIGVGSMPTGRGFIAMAGRKGLTCILHACRPDMHVRTAERLWSKT